MLLPPVVHGGSIITQHIDWPTFIRPFVCVRLSLHYVLAEPHNLPTHMRRVMHACRLGIRVRCGRVLTSGGYSPTHHTIQCGASCTPHWSVVTVDWWQLCVCVLATPFVTHPCVSSTATAALIPHTCGECWLPVSSIMRCFAMWPGLCTHFEPLPASARKHTAGGPHGQCSCTWAPPSWHICSSKCTM